MSSDICFVVSPIGSEGSEVRNHADWLLLEIIEPTLKQFDNFEVIRSDKISAPGLIDTQVIRYLLESKIVIADLSMLNPNVFYEIGIRHMKQLPIIHMQRDGDDIPFDVSLYRAIKFKMEHPNDLTKARSSLNNAIKEVLKEGHSNENPVTQAMGRIEIIEGSSDEMKTILNSITLLQRQVNRLQREFGYGGRLASGNIYFDSGTNIESIALTTYKLSIKDHSDVDIEKAVSEIVEMDGTIDSIHDGSIQFDVSGNVSQNEILHKFRGIWDKRFILSRID